MSRVVPARLRIVSAMISMGERISWGQETSLMDEAADRIEQLEAAIIAALRAPDEATSREILRKARDE